MRSTSEGAAEFAAAVVDETPDRRRSSWERPTELPGLLNGPAAIRVRGAAGEMDAARAELGEEQHIQASEPERLNGEKIAVDDRLSVYAQERTPAEPNPP